MDSRLVLEKEADAWFYRNKRSLQEKERVSEGTKLTEAFLKKELFQGEGKKILEIGSSYGYNLYYLSKKFGAVCYGIDASRAAIEYGRELFEGVDLCQGISNDLPYEDEKFEIVIMGFCLYMTRRKDLMRTISEADRVLKEDGYLILVDFDTAIPYKRDNIHNSEIWTYKMQYINLFLANPQYYLVEKQIFSEKEVSFERKQQERLSFNVLYKERLDNVYIRA